MYPMPIIMYSTYMHVMFDPLNRQLHERIAKWFLE